MFSIHVTGSIATESVNYVEIGRVVVTKRNSTRDYANTCQTVVRKDAVIDVKLH